MMDKSVTTLSAGPAGQIGPILWKFKVSIDNLFVLRIWPMCSPRPWDGLATLPGSEGTYRCEDAQHPPHTLEIRFNELKRREGKLTARRSS